MTVLLLFQGEILWRCELNKVGWRQGELIQV
jgi:hypothetical protein